MSRLGRLPSLDHGDDALSDNNPCRLTGLLYQYFLGVIADHDRHLPMECSSCPRSTPSRRVKTNFGHRKHGHGVLRGAQSSCDQKSMLATVLEILFNRFVDCALTKARADGACIQIMPGGNHPDPKF
jgi:hypothetical protein